MARKFHISRSAGFIHIIEVNDYAGICLTLCTPAEIIEYLNFREKYLTTILDASKEKEKSILGRFLISRDCPDLRLDSKVEDYSYVVDRLIQNKEEWDIKNIIETIPLASYEHTISEHNLDYYSIILELSWLYRTELKFLKDRFLRCVDSANAGNFDLPYRMVGALRQCGIVIMSLQPDLMEKRRLALGNFTLAHKYELKLPRAIGIVIVNKSEGLIVDYLFIESEWKKDTLIEKLLNENYPFRPLKTIGIDRYKFE
jgi:hypothetical protein